MTERQLQSRLTRSWITDGIPLGDECLFLLAGEVMVPSWRINDANRYWSEPSIDFLGVDESGQLAAIELKTRVPGIRPAWRVLCQVTHRATEIARTATPERLQTAFRAIRSGEHGRIDEAESSQWVEDWSEFFGGNTAHPVLRPVRRVVAATAYGPSWRAVLDEFNDMQPEGLLERLHDLGEFDRSKGREPRRLRDIEPPSSTEVTPYVEWMLVTP